MTKTTDTPTPTSMDLAVLDSTSACNRAHEFEITHPVTGEGMGVFFRVLGKDSTVYKAKVRALGNDNLRGRQMDLKTLEEKNIDALVAVMEGWRSNDLGEGKILLGGETLTFSPENCRKVFRALEPVRDQTQQKVNDLGNFMID